MENILYSKGYVKGDVKKNYQFDNEAFRLPSFNIILTSMFENNKGRPCNQDTDLYLENISNL